MWMGLRLLSMPAGELKDEVRKEIESNPALEEVSLPFRKPAGATVGDVEFLADERQESLDEHLLGELRMSGTEGRERELCECIIGELDGDGRFAGSIPDLIMVTGASAAELEAARRRVMALDPLGCGARDLAECFLAQESMVPPAKRALFRKEVANIASGHVSGEILAVLRKLDPFPGRLYAPVASRYVQADIVAGEDGEVEMQSPDLPEIRVSPKYIEMAKDRTLDEETRKYAAERVKRAREFQTALEKRVATLEKVAEIAISGQREALRKGMSAMKRQTMSDVAKKAKCSVATVSRAAARKYVKTPFGTVPLSKFFRRTDQSVIERLKEVLSEAGGKLSDRCIAEEMAKHGFKMARRTVAKYRAMLAVGPSQRTR
jgi:RNA polymerase sigma-54 factor